MRPFGLLMLSVLVATSAEACLPARAPSTAPPNGATADAVASSSPSVASASPTLATAPARTSAPSSSVAQTLSVRPIGPIPSEFRYLETTRRIVLIDPANRRALEVLHYDINDQPSQVEFSSSADGRTLAVIAHPVENVGAIYMIRPETGDTLLVLQQDGIKRPTLSRDGTVLAYQRVSSDPAEHGVWLMDLPRGASRRLITDDVRRVGSPPQPVAWSNDGRWLAVVTNSGGPGGDRVAAIDVTAGETGFDGAGGFVGGLARSGPGGAFADWKDLRLLITSSSGPLAGSRASVDEFDVASGRSSNLFKPGADRYVFSALWRPGEESFAVIEGSSNGGPGSALDISLRALDGSSRRVFQSGFIVDLWWSRDGSRLYVWTGGDDSVGTIVETLSGATFPFCLRGGAAPPCL